jgi:NAD(P)-dependent dehydrogenase (short-subunit alcohol dehydrogenase family)
VNLDFEKKRAQTQGLFLYNRGSTSTEVTMALLSGRRILITGVSRGVGHETAKLFVKEGAEIIGIARDRAKLESLQQDLGRAFEGLQGDVADKSLPARMAEAVSKRWGALDLLINNAAAQKYTRDFEDEDVELLEQHLQSNLLAPHRIIHALLPVLKKGKQPRIINVSSGAGCFASLTPDMPTYRLSKYALNGLTILYAGMLKGKVAVNSLDPGWLKTDMGGPNAPGEPKDGAERLLANATMPWERTGGFWYGDKENKF